MQFFFVRFFSVLGKRLGKSMRHVAEEVRKMSHQDILRFQETKEVTIAEHSLKLTDIKVSHAMVFFSSWDRIKKML